MNARRVGDTACSPPPRTSASPLARFGQHSGPAMRRGLLSSHLLLSGRRRSRASNRAAAISIDRSYGPTICRLPPANAMTDVTQVVLLSVYLEFQSEYAELFLDIFCALSYIAFLSRLLADRYPAARPQDSNNLNGCRYRTILRWENDGRRRTPLHCFAACRRLLLRSLNRRSSVNRYPPCRLR